MKLPSPAVLGTILAGSELLLSLGKRSGQRAVSKDRGSLWLIWGVYALVIPLGIFATYHLRSCRIPRPETVQLAGLGLYLLGLAVRWYAILYLGRYFTTNVAIAADQRVIDTGPYRHVRHPSYAGGLLTLFGLCLTFDNWASLLIIFLPALAVNRWRIHVEEQALLEGLGEPYRAYCRRTKRLLPFIY